MSPALSSKGLFFAVLFVSMASQEMDFIKEIDHGYSLAQSPDNLYKLEALAKKSLKIFPESDELLWRLGRVYFKLGEKSNTESEKTYFFSQCMVQTKKTIKINSQSANGHFFNGLCNGTLGQTQGIWSSLSIIAPFKKDMETTISINPSIEEGGPHRALGNLYLKLPYLLGGNLDKSIRHFQEAIQFGPEFGENYLGLAEAYIENGDFVLAKDVLKIFLDMEFTSQKEESILEWRTEALNFLKIIQN